MSANKRQARCRRPRRGVSSKGVDGEEVGGGCERFAVSELGIVLARGLHVTAAGNAAEVFPREHPGREGPGFAGRVLDWMQHYTAHVT